MLVIFIMNFFRLFSYLLEFFIFLKKEMGKALKYKKKND